MLLVFPTGPGAYLSLFTESLSLRQVLGWCHTELERAKDADDQGKGLGEINLYLEDWAKRRERSAYPEECVVVCFLSWLEGSVWKAAAAEGDAVMLDDPFKQNSLRV